MAHKSGFAGQKVSVSHLCICSSKAAIGNKKTSGQGHLPVKLYKTKCWAGSAPRQKFAEPARSNHWPGTASLTVGFLVRYLKKYMLKERKEGRVKERKERKKYIYISQAA